MPSPLRLAIGSDHAGFPLKRALLADALQGLAVTDMGTYSDEPCDYPDYARAVAAGVAAGTYHCGILICGTGLGMAIAANKVVGIRAVCPGDTYSARLSRQHNDANVLCLGGRVHGPGLAAEIARVWLGEGFAGGRHTARIDKIRALERITAGQAR